MEHMKETFSIPAFMECLEKGEKNRPHDTEVLHEVLISKNAYDVTAMPSQLLGLLKGMKKTFPKYAEEISCCKNISETLKKAQPLPQKKHLL